MEKRSRAKYSLSVACPFLADANVVETKIKSMAMYTPSFLIQVTYRMVDEIWNIEKNVAKTKHAKNIIS